jgi:hypothetical protein
MISAAFILVIASLGIAQGAESGCYPINATDLRRRDALRFDDFRVEAVAQGRPVPVDFGRHPLARRYRTVLSGGARKGPNFAGHFTVIGWGCGSSCVQFAVVDARNGTVFFPQGFASVSGVRVNSEGFEPDASSGGYWGLRYRIDSRLLIVLGALDESADREGATYLLFDEGVFRQVSTTYLRKRRCGDDPDKLSNKRLHPTAAVRDLK